MQAITFPVSSTTVSCNAMCWLSSICLRYTTYYSLKTVNLYTNAQDPVLGVTLRDDTSAKSTAKRQNLSSS